MRIDARSSGDLSLLLCMSEYVKQKSFPTEKRGHFFSRIRTSVFWPLAAACLVEAPPDTIIKAPGFEFGTLLASTNNDYPSKFPCFACFSCRYVFLAIDGSPLL